MRRLRLLATFVAYTYASSIPDDNNKVPIGVISADDFDDIIVIPDIHGDFDTLYKSLFLAFSEIVDYEVSWEQFSEMFTRRYLVPSQFKPMCTKERVILVQLGDIADRGPKTRKIYFLFDKLEEIL